MIILRKHTADAVLCTGGFVSGPVALAALINRTPCYFHESNSLPGITTKLFAPYIKGTFISFPGSRKHMKKGKLIDSGVPIKEREDGHTSCDPTHFGLSADKPIILVTGGSQGSLALNTAIDNALDRITAMGYQLIWQTGKSVYEAFRRKHASRPGLLMFDFTNQMSTYYSIARIAVCRAGALTLAELEHHALPAILIPLPSAAENHQFFNAREQENRGLALLLEQKNLNPDSLCEKIAQLDSSRDEFTASFARLKPNTYAADIARYLIEQVPNKEAEHAG